MGKYKAMIVNENIQILVPNKATKPIYKKKHPSKNKSSLELKKTAI